MSSFILGDTFNLRFTTSVAGVGTTLSGSPVVKAFPGASATGITAGVTLTVDVAGTGDNVITVVASGANGFVAGQDYALLVTTGTVGGTDVKNTWVQEFNLRAAPADIRKVNGTTVQGSGTISSPWGP